MWQLHRALKGRAVGSVRRRVFAAWTRYRDFMKAWRALRAVSRNALKRWLEDQVTQAESAAEKHDMRGVFRVIQRIAPKRKLGLVRVRGNDGRLLTKAEQFHELYQYFSDAFGCSDQLDFQSSCADPCFGEAETILAIQQLKNAKAVPRNSPVAEVWKQSARICTLL